MKILVTLAWRNLWRSRRRTMITIASVFFAVALAINAQSFQQGSYELMIDNMVRFSTGYLQIQDILFEEEPSMDNSLLVSDSLLIAIKPFNERIAYTVPRIQSFALASTEAATRGAMVTGIDPETENRFNSLPEQVVEGRYLAASDRAVLVAEGLAGLLKTRVGDTLVLIGQGYQGSMAAGKYPVKGIVRLRIPELNNNAVYMPLSAAQNFYAAENRLTSLIVMPADPGDADRLTQELGAAVDSNWYVVRSWKYLLQDLLTLMEFDTASNMVIIYILYLVIAFGIFGTILSMMIERTSEFAMLISLGMKRSRLAMVCLLESLFISFTGAIAGALLALPVVAWYHHHPIPLKGDLAEMILQYGFEPVLPFSADPKIFLTQALIVFVMAVIIGFYPVYKIFRMRTVERSNR